LIGLLLCAEKVPIPDISLLSYAVFTVCLNGMYSMFANNAKCLTRWRRLTTIIGAAIWLHGCSHAPKSLDEVNHAAIVEKSRALVPLPPWPDSDERGMANTLGAGTSMRCAYHLSQPDAKVYELSHLRSNEMPSSPWAAPMQYEYSPTDGVPNTLIAHHPGTKVIGVSGAQGTQMDAFGHWGYLDEIWNGENEYPSNKVKYYGGYTEAQIKPTADSPLQKLGIDGVPPIITSAVLLDAKTHLGKGEAMQAGQQIHGKDIEDMLETQGLAWRGLLPGDVLYIYTGWSDHWSEDFYYHGGPGLSFDAAKYLEAKSVVLVALDNPFTDAVNIGQFAGKAEPPPGTPANVGGAPVHHQNLAFSGIHQIQNMALAQMVTDKVWTSCTLILPIKVVGAAGAPVSPVAIGVAN
jgi:kynurenine formamidase